jgi:hypothetical protein
MVKALQTVRSIFCSFLSIYKACAPGEQTPWLPASANEKSQAARSILQNANESQATLETLVDPTELNYDFDMLEAELELASFVAADDNSAEESWLLGTTMAVSRLIM